MTTQFQLTDAELDQITDDIQTISEKDEGEIYKVLGNALHTSGLTVATATDGSPILHPKMYDRTEKINALKSFDFVSNIKRINAKDATNEGIDFWQKFKENLRHALCDDNTIKNIISGEGTLRQYLAVGIPLVLSALGIVSLNPILLAIVIAVFALIVKVGYKSYCDIK